MWTDAALKIIEDGEPYISPEGTKYPRNFPKNEIPGLIPVEKVDLPQTKDKVIGFEIQRTNGLPVQVWKTEPKSAEEINSENFQSRQAVIEAIQRLELTQQRALREVALGNGDMEYTNGIKITPREYLEDLENQIALLRTEIPQ